MSWSAVLSRQAVKDAKKLKQSGLKSKTLQLLQAIEDDPLCNPPPFEKLVGNLKGFYSRRINIQHRLIYRVDEDSKTVHVLRMWTHYE
ncbi:MAG: Txe/YoeB family addiction module toxin [bacterium]|nr:Txe/YoeB family addiction module toxin [bacterium]